MVQKGKINVKERFSDGEVDLSMSDLDEVPVKEIASLKKTTSLDLSNNRLTLLPSNFIVLTHLTKLDLSKNELTELPEEFGSLSKLKYLDLYKNNLERLPLSFGKLSGLKFLDLKDNPLIPTIAKVAGPCVDTKGCQQCAKDVVNFYKRLQEEVDNEVEMRKKAKQKQLEINQQKKQEEKKKLKKEKQQNNKPKKDIDRNTQKKIMSAMKKQTKKDQKRVKENVEFIRTLLFMCFLSLVLVIGLFFLPHLINYYPIFLDKLPESCRYHVENVVSTVNFIERSASRVFESYVESFKNSAVFQGTVIKFRDYIKAMVEKTGDHE